MGCPAGNPRCDAQLGNYSVQVEKLLCEKCGQPVACYCSECKQVISRFPCRCHAEEKPALAGNKRANKP